MHARDLFDLRGQVALVTGGAGIFGTPISEALAEFGAHVVIASRNKEKCREAAAKLVSRGLESSPDTYDQANEKSILALRDRLMEKFGLVDILLNNSVARAMRRYEDPLDAWRQSME